MRNDHFLLVDDNDGCRDSLGFSLSTNDHVVHLAPDGAIALELAKRQPFGLLITDFEMPGMNGVELFKQIRQLQPAIEGILVSGEMTEARTNAALDAGMLAAFHKLFDHSELLALVSATCRRAS